MKKAIATVVASVAVLLDTMTTALADYPPSPKSGTTVQGAGSGGGAETAFTGSEITVAVIVLALLVVMGLVALYAAHQRPNRTA